MRFYFHIPFTNIKFDITSIFAKLVQSEPETIIAFPAKTYGRFVQSHKPIPYRASMTIIERNIIEPVVRPSPSTSGSGLTTVAINSHEGKLTKADVRSGKTSSAQYDKLLRTISLREARMKEEIARNEIALHEIAQKHGKVHKNSVHFRKSIISGKTVQEQLARCYDAKICRFCLSDMKQTASDVVFCQGCRSGVGFDGKRHYAVTGSNKSTDIRGGRGVIIPTDNLGVDARHYFKDNTCSTCAGDLKTRVIQDYCVIKECERCGLTLRSSRRFSGERLEVVKSSQVLPKNGIHPETNSYDDDESIDEEWLFALDLFDSPSDDDSS